MKQTRLYDFYIGTNAERLNPLYFPTMKDGVIFYERDTGDWAAIVDNAWVGMGGGGGAVAFTDLTDVPASYAGHAGKYVVVNGGETGLDFTTLATIPEPSNDGALYARRTLAGVSTWQLVVPAAGGQYTGNVGFGITPVVPLHTLGSVRHEFSTGDYLDFVSDTVPSIESRTVGGNLEALFIRSQNILIQVGTGLTAANAMRIAHSSGAIQLGFYGGTAISKPTGVTALTALQDLGLGSALVHPSFLNLTDTPASYSGHGGKVVAVNAGGTALEFVTGGGGIPEPTNDGNLYARRTLAGVSTWQLVVPAAGGEYTGNVGFGITPAYSIHSLGEVRHQFSAGHYLQIRDSGLGIVQINARNSTDNLSTLQVNALDIQLNPGSGTGDGSPAIRALSSFGTRIGFFGVTPVLKPTSMTARAALEALGLGATLTFEGVSDAISDGYMYARRDGAWVSGGFAFQNDVTIGDGTGSKQLYINGGAGNGRNAIFSTAGSPRIIIRVNGTAESGSNAGSDMEVYTMNDAGALLHTPIRITRSTGYIGINTVPVTHFHLIGNSYIDGPSRVRQAGSTRYRSDRLMQSGGLVMNAYDDTGAAYLPATFYFNLLRIVNQQGGGHVLRLRSSSTPAPYLDFTDSSETTRYGYLQAQSTSMWLASDAGAVTLLPQTGDNARIQISRVTGTTSGPRINFIDGGGSTDGFIDLEPSTGNLRYTANAASTGHEFWANGVVQARLGFSGSSGMTVGPAGSGMLGTGWVNVSAGVARNGGAYSHPGFVFEKEYTGMVTRFKSDLSEMYRGLPSIDELEKQFSQSHRIWLRPDTDMQAVDIFGHAEILEANIEILYLLVIKMHKMLEELL